MAAAHEVTLITKSISVITKVEVNPSIAHPLPFSPIMQEMDAWYEAGNLLDLLHYLKKLDAYTSDARHLLLLKPGFSTKLYLHCLHLTRCCGLCHHPPLSNSGNVSGHNLAGSNKTGCWSSFVNFVASFLSVQFCHPCHLSSYSRLLCPLIWT